MLEGAERGEFFSRRRRVFFLQGAEGGSFLPEGGELVLTLPEEGEFFSGRGEEVCVCVLFRESEFNLALSGARLIVKEIGFVDLIVSRVV